MKNLLFISTIHRMSERMLPAILDFHVRHGKTTILNLGQSSRNTNYQENKRYLSNFDNLPFGINVYDGKGIRNKRDVRSKQYCFESLSLVDEICERHNIDAIVLDDSRDNDLNLALGWYCKKTSIKLFANSHGNTDELEWDKTFCLSNPFYDKLFVFGRFEVERFESTYHKGKYIPGGIPENDSIKNYKKNSKQISVIVNRVVVDGQPSERLFDSSVVEDIGLVDLQKKLQLPVVFKLKDRMSEDTNRDVDSLISYLPKGLDYSIVTHVENELNFLSNSKLVLSYGSTMAFKALQLNIPTIIFKGLGPIGLFSSYKGKCDLDRSYFELIEKLDADYFESFLPHILEGSTTFDATKRYSDYLEEELTT